MEEVYMSPDKAAGMWPLVEAYFRGGHLAMLVRHQLESFNCFVERQIPSTIDMFNPVRIVSDKTYNPDAGKHPSGDIRDICEL